MKKQYDQDIVNCMNYMIRSIEKQQANWQIDSAIQELYCICQTPYDIRQTYMQCDVCQEWYHLQCINLTIEQCYTIDYYICQYCTILTGYKTWYKQDGILPNDYQQLSIHLSNLSQHSPPLFLTRQNSINHHDNSSSLAGSTTTFHHKKLKLAEYVYKWNSMKLIFKIDKNVNIQNKQQHLYHFQQITINSIPCNKKLLYKQYNAYKRYINKKIQGDDLKKKKKKKFFLDNIEEDDWNINFPPKKKKKKKSPKKKILMIKNQIINDPLIEYPLFYYQFHGHIRRISDPRINKLYRLELYPNRKTYKNIVI